MQNSNIESLSLVELVTVTGGTTQQAPGVMPGPDGGCIPSPFPRPGFPFPKPGPHLPPTIPLGPFNPGPTNPYPVAL